MMEKILDKALCNLKALAYKKKIAPQRFFVARPHIDPDD